MGLLPLRLRTTRRSAWRSIPWCCWQARRRRTGAPLEHDALSDRLGVPGAAIAEIAECLERAELLVRGRRTRFWPGARRAGHPPGRHPGCGAPAAQGTAYLHVRSLAPVHGAAATTRGGMAGAVRSADAGRSAGSHRRGRPLAVPRPLQRSNALRWSGHRPAPSRCGSRPACRRRCRSPTMSRYICLQVAGDGDLLHRLVPARRR